MASGHWNKASLHLIVCRLRRKPPLQQDDDDNKHKRQASGHHTSPVLTKTLQGQVPMRFQNVTPGWRPYCRKACGKVTSTDSSGFDETAAYARFGANAGASHDCPWGMVLVSGFFCKGKSWVLRAYKRINGSLGCLYTFGGLLFF